MNKEKTYIFHSDSGHGWLAVKREELIELNIETEISQFSFEKGKTIYLEEDRDLTIFFITFRQKYGHDPIFRESYIDGRSPIRSYEIYQNKYF